MKRREFITLLGGMAAGWPLGAYAQQDDRLRRVGVLLPNSESDPAFQVGLPALRQKLLQLGWIEGRNLQLDVRFSAANFARVRGNAQDLVDLAPHVIVVSFAAATKTVQERTQTIPIVFVQVGDPVASGVVGSIARPEGNTTGITNLFPSIAGKWVELLKEAAPHVTRVAYILNAELNVNAEPPAPRGLYVTAIEAAAAALAVKAIRTPVRSDAEIERSIDAFATEPNGALILVPPILVYSRALVFGLARRHRLPVITPNRFTTAEGGLMSYGPDITDLYRGAASYVDRILRGAKPGDLPVQFPTKFELVINLKTAKTIGLAIPRTLVARADEVIE